MAKFIIKEVSTVVTTYEVEAKNEEQAEDELYNGVSKELKEERSDVYIDSIEEKKECPVCHLETSLNVPSMHCTPL